MSGSCVEYVGQEWPAEWGEFAAMIGVNSLSEDTFSECGILRAVHLARAED